MISPISGRNALVVYNPKAGSATQLHKQIDTIRNFLQHNLSYAVTLYETTSPRHEFDLDELYRRLGHIELIVAAGGDGTVAGVLEATAKYRGKIPVAVVPLGTGNLLARTMNVYPAKMHRSLWEYAVNLYLCKQPSDEVLKYALNVIASGEVVDIDMALANDQFMSTGAGIGPLARAMANPRSAEKQTRGMRAYVYSMLRQAQRSHRTFLIKIDDEDPFEMEAMGVFVSNLPNLGIGTPHAVEQMQDGLLDVFVVNCSRRAEFYAAWLRFIGWLLSNNPVPPYLHRRARKVCVTVLSQPAGAVPESAWP